jgi:hypothetical protein
VKVRWVTVLSFARAPSERARKLSDIHVYDCKIPSAPEVRIRLTNEERTGIQGWGTELRGGGSECVMAGLKQREEVSEIYRGDGGKLTWRGLARD